MLLETTIKLYRPFDEQRRILDDPTRFKVIAIGRQWGKSELTVIDGVQRLLRGEHVWFCSPTHENNKRMYPKFKAALSRIPQVYSNDTDKLIRLPNDAFIKFVSLDAADNLRGEGLHHIYIDEAAFIKQGVFDKVLRPMLGARQGSAWFLSSPNGRNEFWHWFQLGNDPEQSDWITFHAPSHTSPVWTDDELAKIERTTPSRAWRQEYLAEFLDDGGAVFRNIQACVSHEIPSKTSNSVVFGVDLGRSNDYTVITAIDTATGNVLDIERFTDTGWAIQGQRLQVMAQRWNPDVIWIEENFNDSFAEQMHNEGLPVRFFRTGNKNKAQIINALALAFEQEEITIPDDMTLIGELQAYSVDRTSSGLLKYGAPSGLHDDMVMSLALAWHGVISGHVKITVSRYA